ncbi:MAG: divalent-cation tolerance protein CutA [Deltaproteobacteria bacterium]|nr:divalent-cation tolerance protein CutA [Deltaproteobacteria bacterium]
MEKTFLVYVTASSHEEALVIARKVVEERLAACANLLGNMDSIYWWEDKVQQEKEVPMIMKTSGDRLDALIGRIKELHSYSCPCVVAVPILGGNPDFMAWIRKETAIRSKG